jgi:hypothetical protein
MKRVASFSVFTLFLTTLFLFAAPIPQAQAAACATPTQSSFTETGTAYTVQTFNTKTTNCSWAVPTGVSSLRIIIVGGGGGAAFGSCGGGGGAGRVLVSKNAFSVSPGSQLTLTVGDSGTGGWVNSLSTSWVIGKNGESSSVTINGNTYIASGGGGGGGGQSTAVGLMGGSGGGGTACVSALGGAADVSPVTGFDSYANEGGTGSGKGGGGGGAGGSGTAGNGGNGIPFWGATFAGGGGGWSGGSGGTGGGGSAGTGTDTRANAGSPGTPGTGSGGGGGNDGGCGRIMIRYLVNATVGAPTVSGSAYKGIAITITVTSTVAGRVRFLVGGKRIQKCISNATGGTAPNFAATCSWIPPNRGYVTLTAIFIPTDLNYSIVNSSENKVFVLSRTTTR